MTRTSERLDRLDGNDPRLRPLRQRYRTLGELVLDETFRRCATPGGAFDALDTFPKKLPARWCPEAKRWVGCDHLGGGTD